MESSNPDDPSISVIFHWRVQHVECVYAESSGTGVVFIIDIHIMNMVMSSERWQRRQHM